MRSISIKTLNGESLNICETLFQMNIEYLEDICEKLIVYMDIHSCNILQNDLHSRYMFSCQERNLDLDSKEKYMVCINVFN